MYKLFRKPDPIQTGIIRIPAFDLIRRVYREQVSRIVRYYQTNSKLLTNEHVLIRILNIATPDIDLELDTYVSSIYSRVPFVANHFKLTSDRSYGRLHNDLFYRGANILLSEDEHLSVYDTIADWRNKAPVVVRKHPISSLQFTMPDATRYPTVETGLSVVSVDIPMMLLMYREFLKEQRMLPEGERKGANAFVARYVLPNMLYSHSDLSIYNRMRNLYYNEVNISNERTKHPMPIINYENRIDGILRELLKRLSGRSMPYSSYLKTIPAIYNSNAESMLLMPDIVTTKQSWWALYLTRLDDMMFLIELGNREGEAMNGQHITSLKIDASRLLRDNAYSMLPTEMQLEVESKLLIALAL